MRPRCGREEEELLWVTAQLGETSPYLYWWDYYDRRLKHSRMDRTNYADGLFQIYEIKLPYWTRVQQRRSGQGPAMPSYYIVKSRATISIQQQYRYSRPRLNHYWVIRIVVPRTWLVTSKWSWSFWIRNVDPTIISM